MTVTASAANFVRNTDTSTGVGDPMTAVLPTNVPAGALWVVGIMNRTNETAVITSISDGINGAWGAGQLRQGPTDSSTGTLRTWYYARTNSSATSSAGERTVTVEFDGTVSAQIVSGWVSSSLGAMTFDAVGTAVNTTATNWDSNTVAAAGAGVALGLLMSVASQASVTVDGAGETHLTTASDAGSFRSNFFSEITSGASTPSFEITLPSNTSGIFHIAHFLEPAGSSVMPLMVVHNS